MAHLLSDAAVDGMAVDCPDAGFHFQFQGTPGGFQVAFVGVLRCVRELPT